MGIQYSLVSAAKPGAKAVESKKKQNKEKQENELRIVLAMVLFVECHGSLGILSLDLGIGRMLPCLKD